MTRMTKKNIRLIKQSIAHWQRMHDNKRRKGERPVGDDCALCGEYFDSSNDRCDGCPIKAKTGQDHCRGTPYYDAWVAFSVHGFNSPEFTREAKRMIEFLAALLPEEDRS